MGLAALVQRVSRRSVRLAKKEKRLPKKLNELSAKSEQNEPPLGKEESVLSVLKGQSVACGASEVNVGSEQNAENEGSVESAVNEVKEENVLSDRNVQKEQSEANEVRELSDQKELSGLHVVSEVWKLSPSKGKIASSVGIGKQQLKKLNPKKETKELKVVKEWKLRPQPAMKLATRLRLEMGICLLTISSLA